MCGRSRCALAPERVEQLTGVNRERWVDRDRYQPCYNVSPGGWTPILRLDDAQQLMLQTMRWGLVPSFTKPGSQLDFYKMFNARSESVAEKPVFSRLLTRHRCVVLLEGFYEWKADAGKKQPYFISLGEGQVVHMAGLFDVYSGGEEGPLATYTILTVDSCKRLTWLHDRMPVLLTDAAAVESWLGGSSDGPQAAPLQLCAPCNSEALCWHPVTSAMSKPDYNKPDASSDVRKKKGAITSFFKPSPTKPSKAAAASPAKPSAAASSPAKPSAAAASPAKRQAASAADPSAAAVSPAEFQKQQPPQPQSQQQQQQGQSDLSAGLNPDEESGPTAVDEAAAAAQVHSGTSGATAAAIGIAAAAAAAAAGAGAEAAGEGADAAQGLAAKEAVGSKQPATAAAAETDADEAGTSKKRQRTA